MKPPPLLGPTSPHPYGEFTRRLKQLTDKLGLILNGTRIDFPGNSAMWVEFELHPEAGFAFASGVVRTHGGLPGDRSDYHELISSIWAIHLRTQSIASVRLMDIPHPVVVGELSGRRVFFESQPDGTYISLENPDFTSLERILAHSKIAAAVFSMLWMSLGGRDGRHGDEKYDVSAAVDWGSRFTKTLRFKLDHVMSGYNIRHLPNWSFFRRYDRGIAALRFPAKVGIHLLGQPPASAITVIGAKQGLFVISGTIRNLVADETLKIFSRALRAYGHKVELDPNATSLTYEEAIQLVPVDSHVFCLLEDGLISIARESGDRAFVEAREELRKEQARFSILFSPTKIEWLGVPDDERFEELVLELIRREKGVDWARRVGHSSASDAGRDILVDWFLGTPPWHASEEEPALQRRRVVVQCKAYQRAINLSNVPDVPKILDLHKANGYLLVAFPRITAQVVDYFTSVPERRDFWADWWTQAELEEKLRSNLDIAARYIDLFKVVEDS